MDVLRNLGVVRGLRRSDYAVMIKFIVVLRMQMGVIIVLIEMLMAMLMEIVVRNLVMNNFVRCM